ncbi:MAG: divalent-cation tolerance protein CutA [Acidobacteriia bacterium]|nr:divalent-cation tolerance protein CutA [Terriglobia bacterium]
MTDKIVVFSTCASRQEASTLARALVEKRLAACVNIIPAARSIYWWQGEVVDEEEFLLVVKSRRDLLHELQEQLCKIHSYQVPEVIALAVVEGSPEYIKWLDRELAPASD